MEGGAVDAIWGCDVEYRDVGTFAYAQTSAKTEYATRVVTHQLDSSLDGDYTRADKVGI